MNHYPTSPVTITLADNKERRLRYSLGAVKRIKAKYANAPGPSETPEANQNPSMIVQGKILGAIGSNPEEALPYLLMEGFTEKEGLTEEVILDMLTGPEIEAVSLKVIEAFFGQRLAKRLREQADLEDAALDRLISEAHAKLKPTPKAEEPVTSNPSPSLLN